MGTKRLRRHVRHMLEWAAAARDDIRLSLGGGRDRELPPMRLRFVGAGDFRAVGEELKELLGRFGLKPDHRVLDIGSGVGRVAIPLTHYLDTNGTYDGFDIVRRGITWCRRNITPRFPNFRFHHVKVRSSEYRERGTSASSFHFPFADDSFEYAFATSLFTHLVLAETRQYLRESARVLAPGGFLFATFFLINDHVHEVLPRLDAHYRFPVDQPPLRLADANNPAVGVAIHEAVLTDMIREAGFSSFEIHYGKWAARPDGVTFQDLVLCRR